MSSLNKVMLIGNLTRDPELKTVKSGANFVEMGLAINRTTKSENGEKREETTFIEVTIWGNTAQNVAKYLKKGRSVLVEGRLQLDTWQDQTSGQSRSKLRVIGETVQFMGSSNQDEQQSGNTSPGNPYRQAA